MTALPENEPSQCEPDSQPCAQREEFFEVFLPAERFFWALLDFDQAHRITADPRNVVLHAQLDEAFAAHIPCPVEAVATTYAPLSGNRVLACALRLVELESLADRHTLAVCPAQIPAWAVSALPSPSPADEPRLDPRSLNILAGQREPRLLRRARHVRSLALALAILAPGLICSVGMLRREHAALRRIAAAERSIEQASRSPALAELRGHAHDTPALEALAASLGETPLHTADPRLADAGAVLQSFLAAWPTASGARVNGLTATGAQVQLNASLPTYAAAESFVAAFSGHGQLRPLNPQLQSRGDRVDLRVEFENTPGHESPARLSPTPHSPDSSP